MPMLLSFDRLVNTPVMSLQTGAELARTKRVIIDPRDLTIVAYELDGHLLDEHPAFLRPGDVRELSNLGFIVDSSDEFVGLEDVIKIKQVYDYHFDILGLDVVDDKKKKLGRVSSINVDSASFSVQQLVVKRSLLKSFGETELLIHRSQVIEVSDDYIKVRSGELKHKSTNGIRSYTNPFRTGNVQPEAFDTEIIWN